MAEQVVAIEGLTISNGAISTISTIVPVLNTSVSAGAKVAAPGLGVAVATIAAGSLPAGYYEIVVNVGVSGTLAAVDGTNMELKVGGTSVMVMANSAINTTANPIAGPYVFRTLLTGSQNLTVNAIAAATASSVYHATIVASKLN